MCICCCFTRKSLLIYSLVISSLAFVYGIIAISQFASKTENYKLLKGLIDAYDSAKANSRRLKPSNYYYDDEYYRLEIDARARYNIYLNIAEFGSSTYGLIKRLKGIENGLGSILFVFPILFLAAEIAYVVFVSGIRETQVLSMKAFAVLNVLKILTYTFSIIFIFFAIGYGALLLGALIQYMNFAEIFDSCATRILAGMFFGYYSFWYYITLACIFGRERQYFVEVGNETAPGPRATYDINGKPIVRAIIPNQQIIGIAPQMMIQPVNLPYQQVQVVNTPYNQQIPVYDKGFNPQQPIQQQSQQPIQQQPQQQIEQEPKQENQNPTSGRRLSNKNNKN